MADPLIEIAEIERRNAGILMENWGVSLGSEITKKKLAGWIKEYDAADIHKVGRDALLKLVADYATYIVPAAKKYEAQANALLAEGIEMTPLEAVKSSKKIQIPPEADELKGLLTKMQALKNNIDAGKIRFKKDHRDNLLEIRAWIEKSERFLQENDQDAVKKQIQKYNKDFSEMVSVATSVLSNSSNPEAEHIVDLAAPQKKLDVPNQELKSEKKITDEQKQELEQKFEELKNLSDKIYATGIGLDDKQTKAMLDIQEVLYKKPMDSNKVTQALEEAGLVHNFVTRPNAKVIDLLQEEKKRISDNPKCDKNRGTARVHEIENAIERIEKNRNMTDADLKKCVTGLLKFDDKVKEKLGMIKKEEASPLMQAVEHVKKNSPR